MAGMNYQKLTKELRGTGMVLHTISHKINNDDEFELESGPSTVLRFVNSEISNAFVNEDLALIERWYSERRSFFFDRDNPNLEYKVTSLTRTPELGGQSGGSSPGDPHELMTGALILEYGQRGQKGIPARDFRTEQNINTLATNAQNSAAAVLGNIPNKTEKIGLFGEDLVALAQAISAANGFLKNLSSGATVVRVYATGQSWDNVLQRYRIKSNTSGQDGHLFFGKQDYNSSDLIVEVLRTGNQPIFVGVSLKKKGISKSAADPTVLNKTVMGTDGLLRSLVRHGYVNATRDYVEIHKKRGQFWYDVIKFCLTQADPRTRMESERRLIRSTTIPEYLADLEKKIKIRQQRQYIINQAQKLGQTNMNKAVYSQYPEGTTVVNEYFRALNAMLTNPRHAQAVVISLANIIFKTDLQGYLKLRNRGPIPDFRFTLITGKGAWTQRNGLQIRPAAELQEYFTTTMICDAMNNTSGSNYYKVEKTPGKMNAYERGATSSKIYFDIWMGTLLLANMEIRYKGKISQEPQFFAVISPAFKNEYLKVKRDGGGNTKW